LLRFRPELRLSQDGVAARDFVRDGFVDGVVTRLAYDCSYSVPRLLEPWARELLRVRKSPAIKRVGVRVATHFLCALVRMFVPPPDR